MSLIVLAAIAALAIAYAAVVHFRAQSRLDKAARTVDGAIAQAAARAAETMAAQARVLELERGLHAWNSTGDLMRRCVQTLLRAHPDLGDEWLRIVLAEVSTRDVASATVTLPGDAESAAARAADGPGDVGSVDT